MVFSVITLQAQEYMSLERAREMALAKSEDIKIAGKMLEKSTAERNAARTNYLPSISASATSFTSKMILKKNCTFQQKLPI